MSALILGMRRDHPPILWPAARRHSISWHRLGRIGASQSNHKYGFALAWLRPLIMLSTRSAWPKWTNAAVWFSEEEQRVPLRRFTPPWRLAVVQSIPDGNVALIAAGIRDFPADAGFPTLLADYRNGRLLAEYEAGLHSMVKANDQHGYLPIDPSMNLRIGDVLKFGISHPCTAFDKWPILFFLIEPLNTITQAIRTYF